MAASNGGGRLWLIIGALFGLTGVAAGALGAHALSDILTEEKLGTFETAVRYQVYHALVLVGLTYVRERWGGRLPSLAGWSFTAGIVLFSGSLYVLALTGLSIMGAVAPLGGAALIGGWALLLATALRR